MERLIEDCTDIVKIPALVQQNYAPVTPYTEKYILSGEQCYFDNKLYAAFSKDVNVKNSANVTVAFILKILGVIMSFAAVIPLTGTVITAINAAAAPDKDSFTSFLISAVMPMVFIIFPVVLFRAANSLKKKTDESSAALKAVETGQALCFRYKCFGILRYTYNSGGDREYKYYADLKNFAVELPNPSEKWGRAKYVYAAVANINGRNTFFLFNAES